MVVYYVTLHMRVTMRRSTGISAFFSLLRSGSASAIVLATILSCSDSMSPTKGLQDGVVSVEMIVPDSVKQALAAQFSGTLLSAPVAISANVLVSPVATLSSSLSSCGSGGAFAGYTESKVPFAPESTPSIAPSPLYDDGRLEHVPLGFSFSFYGNTYSETTVYSNGFIKFGPAIAAGFWVADLIPYAANPNSIIALGWSDWQPNRVPGSIRYETRGNAPNRRFILQFTNVPEYRGSGLLTSQLVLDEGSNDITIYTNTVSLTYFSNRLTQGIENANGTAAAFDSVQNPMTGVWSSRVKGVFKLSNDAVRFSAGTVSDEENPSITAPANITDKGNDPGLASAVVAVGSPVTSDNCSEPLVSSVRSDGVAIDAPYPVGTTTITWTATDAAGNTASATQSVTVLDKEAPVFASSTQSILKFNATSPAGAVVTYSVNASDNVGVTSLSCEPASGSVFPIGPNPVSCSASDAAGNSSSKSFSVFVVDAHTQVGDLLAYVRSLNLPNGTAQPLINQLRSAYKEQGNECKKMADFIHLVKKKKANIDGEFVDVMTIRATEIMGAWACEGASESVPVSGSSQPRTSQLNF